MPTAAPLSAQPLRHPLDAVVLCSPDVAFIDAVQQLAGRSMRCVCSGDELRVEAARFPADHVVVDGARPTCNPHRLLRTARDISGVQALWLLVLRRDAAIAAMAQMQGARALPRKPRSVLAAVDPTAARRLQIEMLHAQLSDIENHFRRVAGPLSRPSIDEARRRLAEGAIPVTGQAFALSLQSRLHVPAIRRAFTEAVRPILIEPRPEPPR